MRPSKTLALDCGSARMGLAVSGPMGTLARPLDTVANVGEAAGVARLLALIAAEAPQGVGGGVPLTLRGETYEGFTSKLAGGDDAQAAAHLLADRPRWRQTR